MGLGCMGMAFAYGDVDLNACLQTLDVALEKGLNFFDTSDMYGMGENERFLGHFINKQQREKIVIATKCGIVINDNNPLKQSCNTRPDYIKSACDASLERLGVDVIDLFYLHRLDGVTPLEDSMGALADLHRAGKIRAAGLSEVTAETIRHANATFPVSAVQNEYSLMSRGDEVEAAIDACIEVGATFVPYAPICRGLLTGRYRDSHQFGKRDYRSLLPRFRAEALEKNNQLVDAVGKIANHKGTSPVQLALAWVMSRADNVVPIPGTRRVDRLLENIEAVNIVLSHDDRERLTQAVPVSEIVGGRS